MYKAIEVSFDWDKDFSEPENIIADGCIEDDYERCQMGLRSLLQTLNCEDILQIWAIMLQGSFPNHFSNHVVIFADGTHLCTCLTLISKGIVCRHFFKVLIKSYLVRFYISLISSR